MSGNRRHLTKFPFTLAASDIMGQVGFLKFIQDQWWKVAPVEHVDLTGKTVVVIGANVGLGFEAAKHFASMNPKKLVLGCRSQEKGQAALQGKRADLSTKLSPPLTWSLASHTSHRFQKCRAFTGRSLSI
jgi:hypothetical protein